MKEESIPSDSLTESLDLVPRRSTLAAIKDLGVALNQQKRTLLGALLLVVAMLGATLGIVVFGMELTKDMQASSDGRLLVKGSDRVVETASSETNMSDTGLMMSKATGKAAQVDTLKVPISALRMYSMLQHDESRGDAIRTLSTYKEIHPRDPMKSVMAGQKVGKSADNARLRKAVVHAMEVFEIYEAEGENATEHLAHVPEEHVAVAHTPLGRFALQAPRGWTEITDEQYSGLKEGKTLSNKGGRRRGLFWCGGWKKRRSLQAAGAGSHDGASLLAALTTPAEPRREAASALADGSDAGGRALQASTGTNQCVQYVEAFNRLGDDTLDGLMSNIDRLVPPFFEQSRSTLDILGKCALDINYLGTAYTKDNGKTLRNDRWMDKAALRFYEFVVELSSYTCKRGATCVIRKKWGPLSRKFTSDSVWCNTEPTALMDLFCEYMIAYFYDLYGVNIFEDCTLYALYVEAISEMINDDPEEFLEADLCTNAEQAVVNILCDNGISGVDCSSSDGDDDDDD